MKEFMFVIVEVVATEVCPLLNITNFRIGASKIRNFRRIKKIAKLY